MKIANGVLSFVLVALMSSLNGGVVAAKIGTASKPAKRAFASVKNKTPASFNVGGVTIKAPSAPSKTFLPVSTHTAIALSMVLAFNSGLINGACLSGMLAEGTKQATAAVTGAWTNSALGMAKGGASGMFALNAKCILSYMGGSLLSGLAVPTPTTFNLDVTGSLPLFGLASGLLIAAAGMAGDKNSNYLFLCCIANGISNSLTSTLTANLCRTAHFSGITSDIGTFAGQCLRGNKTNLLKLKTFAVLAACFWAGGLFSYGLTESFGNVVLEGSALIHLVFAIYLGLKMFKVV